MKILSKAVVQAKKATIEGTLLHQIHLQGKEVLSRGIKTLQNKLTSNRPLLEGGGGLVKLVDAILSQTNGVQLIEEQSKEFQLPIMSFSNKINVPLMREPLEN